jgi:hypothetical protein
VSSVKLCNNLSILIVIRLFRLLLFAFTPILAPILTLILALASRLSLKLILDISISLDRGERGGGELVRWSLIST